MNQSLNNEHLAEQVDHVFEDWLLTPEGAVIHLVERVAVVADLHLGYEWARGAAGDSVIAHSLDETLLRLALVLQRAPVARLVVAGDLVESPRPCPRTRADVRQLSEWLVGRGVCFLALEGNHDRSLARPQFEQSRPASSMPMTCTIAGWTIVHGHRPMRGARTMSGHHHPVLRVGRTSAPCFLVGPGRIVLPALSANAAGRDIATSPLPAELRGRSLRCIVSTGSELLDFGTLVELRRRLRRPTV
jgi:putative SbcD/Mre11-related phosphoesterase